MKEQDLWVHSFRMPPESNNSIKMEVGIEDCLHIEFEYNKSKYVSSLYILPHPPPLRLPPPVSPISLADAPTPFLSPDTT